MLDLSNPFILSILGAFICAVGGFYLLTYDRNMVTSSSATIDVDIPSNSTILIACAIIGYVSSLIIIYVSQSFCIISPATQLAMARAAQLELGPVQKRFGDEEVVTKSSEMEMENSRSGGEQTIDQQDDIEKLYVKENRLAGMSTDQFDEQIEMNTMDTYYGLR